MSHLFLELQDILINTPVLILQANKANSAGVIRERIDASFQQYPEWEQQKSGGTDWTKRRKFNQSIVVRMGVEIQVSGRSDMLARDIVHLRNDLQKSVIDVGVIVVPSDFMAPYLTDRVADFSYARQYAEKELKEAQDYPIILIGIEHDGYDTVPLPKKKTNIGKAKSAP